MAKETIEELQTEIETLKAQAETAQAEITRLKAHSEDLLAERKAEQKRREDAETTLQTLTIERDGLHAKVEDMTLTGPVLRAIEAITPLPPAVGRKILEEAGIKFAIGTSGFASVINDGQEFPLSELLNQMATKIGQNGIDSFDWFLRSSGASGSGATGGTSSGFHSTPKPEPQEPLAKGLGLR